ncbi:ERAD-associated E3 ubiquitin-protein ligase HRD1 [Smittium mucronatum]|uniref:RING-type E3 ubiquitin transferase n=1 Tax=Smittium mucronatum TaxID=133383 RepID=A0A1R0GZT1_9FUNG|nr:ERAD-associated E3 ubiquitin-protein ligase HRD1 [Smittium mucronatum]
MLYVLRHQRFALYGLVTVSVLLFQVLKEYYRYKSFFPICVALAQSGISVLIFHWLLDDRIEYLEQRPVLDTKMVYRMAALSSLLMICDVSMVFYALNFYHIYGAGMVVIFGFEYALLAINLKMTIVKFIFSCVNNYQEREWHSKAIYLFYIELISDLLKLVVYSALFYILLTNYGLPLHIMRDIYLTTSSFISKCKDWFKYREAMKYMDEQYATLDQAQLDQLTDRICIICREEIIIVPNSADVPKRLGCGHVFHFYCLRSWLARQQSCPTCRSPVLDVPPPSNTAAPNIPVPNANPIHNHNNNNDPNHPLNPETSNSPSSQNSIPTSMPNVNNNYIDQNSRGPSHPSAPGVVPDRPLLPHEYLLDSQQMSELRSKLIPVNTNLPSSNPQTNSSAESSSHKKSGSTQEATSSQQPPSTSNPLPKSSATSNPSSSTSLPPQPLNLQDILRFNNPQLLGQFSSLGLPQLIPLTLPSSSQPPTNSNGISNPSNTLPIQNMQLPNLESLSDDQIERLNSSTRDAVRERLRVLAQVQLQLQNITDILTQLNSCQ